MLGDRADLGDEDQPTALGPSDIERLYETELPKLVRYIGRKLGPGADAADFAHDSFLKLLRMAPTLALRTPEAYLRRIATNLLRDHRDKPATRLEASALPIEEGWSADSGIDQHRALEAREELLRVEKVLAKLKPITRHIFWLHRVEGLTYKDIQEQLDLSEGVVKAHMRKAIARMSRYRNTG